MSILKGKQKYWVLGASAGILVLAGGLCAILLSGKNAQIAQSPMNTPAYTSADATAIPQTNIAIGTPEVDLVAEQHRQEIEAIVIRNTMLPGTHIYGVDVGGMSREQAKAAVEEKLAKEPPVINLFLTDGVSTYSGAGLHIQPTATATAPAEEEEDDDAVDPALKAAEADTGADDEEPEGTPAPVETSEEPASIRFVLDVDGAVDIAFSLMRDNTLVYETFMAEVAQISNGRDITPAPIYDKPSVEGFVAALAQIIDVPAVNSKPDIDKETNALVFVSEVPGKGIDQPALIDAILQADPLSGDTIQIPITVLEPTTTREMLEGKYTKRGPGYTTSFSDSTKNRKYNIRFGADKINGTILKPGEVFSANDTLGKRTRKNGWKNAGAYEGGEVVQQAGGGVCQLSSTLYNAVLYADLEIVERRNHSMPVHYVMRGRDATINSVGNIIDFKFRNNTSGDIIILAYTEGNNLHMEIYGLPFETDEYDRIEIRTKQTGSQGIKTEYTYDDTKKETYKKTTSNGSKGYTVRTYKDYYKGETLVKTDDLGLSVYKMFPKKVTVGTIPVETSSDSESTDG